MSHEFELETVYRVYDNNEGACLEVRPDPGGIGLELWTPDVEVNLRREAASQTLNC